MIKRPLHVAEAIAVLAVAVPLFAAQLTLRVVRHGVADDVAITLSREDSPAAEAVRVTVPASADSAKLELPSGRWMLEAVAANAWHGRQYATVAADREIAIPLWPAAALTGALRSNARVAPVELLAGFEGRAANGEPVTGATHCAIERQRFRCAVPAGTLDLRLRAPEHIGQFLWSVRLPECAARDVGELALRVGQAIVGRIELPRHAALDPTKTVIVARPAGTAEGSGPLLTGSLLLPQTVRAEKNGIFHIDGVVPGAYVLVAHHPGGFVSEEVNVVVREGLSAVDLTEPLLLAEPKRMQLAITPALTPRGEPWRVSIARVIGPDVTEPISGSMAARSGAWSSPPLPPAQYELTVSASFDDVWSRQRVKLADRDEYRALVLSGRVTSGRVTLGGKPIAATLSFGDGEGRSADVQSDAEGHFDVLLPNRGGAHWDVTVITESPYLRRTLDVTVLDGEELSIDVPASSISGKVVTELGEPVARALVSIASAATTLQPSTGPDGVFVAYGLPSGATTISAESVDRDADGLTVDYDEHDPPAPLTLVAHPRRELSGDVLSAAGPVAGAQVVIAPVDSPQSRLFPTITGGDGTFVAKLAQHAEEVDVLIFAPGFSFLFCRRPTREGYLRVRVDQRGGTLMLRTPPHGVFLVHDGAAIHLELLENRWPVQAADDSGGRLAIKAPMLDPGVYALCEVAAPAEDAFMRSGGRVGATACVTGALDPLGTLALELAPKTPR